MLNVDRGAVVVANRTAKGKTTLAMLAAAAANLSAAAAVTANGRVVGECYRIDDHAAAAAEAIVSHDCPAAGAATIATSVTTQAGIAESIPTVSTVSCGKMKCRVADRNVTETVNTTTVSFAGWFRGVTPIPGITGGRDRAFKRRVIDSYAAAGDIDSATLGRSTKSTISVSVLIDVATIAADGRAVLDSRSVDVKRPGLEVDGSTFGWRAGAIVEVAAIAALG